jgi:glycosyltransferase involved in cell wall biosynthesis
LLFVARRPPFPLVNGARIRTHRLLTGLTRDFDVTFLTFEHDPASPDGHMGRDELERELPEVDRIVTVPGCGPGKRLRQAGTLLSRRSWEYGRYETSTFRRKLRELVASEQPQMIHFDDLGVAQHGPIPGRFNVYSAHNVEFRILEGTVANSNGPRQLFARVERGKVEPLERRTWLSMDLSLACSELDGDVMRAGGADVFVCPNGSDPVDQLPMPPLAGDDPMRLLFVGSGSYRPNQLGLEWFLENVAPLLRERRLRFVVEIVGSPPKKLPAASEVVIHGRVPSVEPFYERAHVSLVPVLFGSGTRLKVVEAMAYGRPVISTSAGAEGLPVLAGEHYYEADDPAGFAAAVLDVAARCRVDDLELSTMLARARTAVTPLFWPQIVESLARMYLRCSTPAFAAA